MQYDLDHLNQKDISQDKALLLLMAIACGICAGANYYSQLNRTGFVGDFFI